MIVVQRRPAFRAAAGTFSIPAPASGPGMVFQLLGNDQAAHFVMAKVGAPAHGLTPAGL